MQAPNNVLEWIDNNSVFLILGHKDPDGDCVGSQLAITRFLNRIGKTAIPLSKGAFKTTEVKSYEKFFTKNITETELNRLQNPVIIVLDTSTQDRLGEFAYLTDRYPTLVIDHHIAGEDFGTLKWEEPSAPSTTYMVQSIIETKTGSISQEEAFFVFYGLATDTGFFRFLEEGSAHVFKSAARLVDAGISPRNLYLATQKGQTLKSRKWLGIMLSNMEILCDGKFVIFSETMTIRNEYPDGDRQTDLLYNIVLDTDQCEAIAAIREEPNGGCKVSMRSKKYLDVASIAKSFGGGGHKHAAGFETKAKLESIKKTIKSLFEQNCK
ncbi:DHH family phosphoesterase [Spirochaetia bacterium 38H-sp]|uniref:DHH family phosphoesterase n=1 Tax=Rarispira pelagica TaxID=3141764 RepID=A0ABU9UDK8_9SPIR